MNTDAIKGNRTVHQISMQARESMEVNGVTEVISFDEESVTLNTVCGMMTVEGASLHINVLNIEQGIVTMEGKIDLLSYYETESNDKNAKSGVFGKLFR